MTIADEEKSLPKRLAIFQRSTNFLKEILHILPKISSINHQFIVFLQLVSYNRRENCIYYQKSLLQGGVIWKFAEISTWTS